MKTKIQSSVRWRTWQEAKAAIRNSDPVLCELIDELSPGKELKLLCVSYPYGAKIYQDGIFYLPSENGPLNLNNTDIPLLIREQLSYSPVPLGCITKGSFEVFKAAGDHTFPLAHRRNGLSLGIWEAFAPPSPFIVTSGARSMFLLPKITDVSCHKKLKKYGVRSPLPFNAFDQWLAFSEMANHADFSEDWQCEIYFFTKTWRDKIFNDQSWYKLYNHLLRKGIQHIEPSSIKITYDTVWENFSLLLNSRRMKPNHYIVETFKHLIYMATGILPAFKVVKDSIPAPRAGILKAYLDEYGLKNYIPTLMYADYFNRNSDDFAYYSLQIPTCPTTISKNKNSTTTKFDLVELIDLVDHFTYELTNQNLGPGSDYIHKLFSEVEFDFFHSEAALDSGIYPASEMPKEDPALLLGLSGYDENKEFCNKSSFVRGCVRISKK